MVGSPAVVAVKGLPYVLLGGLSSGHDEPWINQILSGIEVFAVALRKWRPRKRSCQVLYTLAKEPTIKVWVKSLPQLLFTVAFARDCSATASSIRADAEACPGCQP